MGMENSFSLKTSDDTKILVNYFCNFQSLHNYIKENFDGKISDECYKCSIKDLKLLKYELENLYKELHNIGQHLINYYDDSEYPVALEGNPMLISSYYFRPTRDYNGGKIYKLYQTVCALLMLLENDFSKQLEVIYECSY